MVLKKFAFIVPQAWDILMYDVRCTIYDVLLHQETSYIVHRTSYMLLRSFFQRFHQAGEFAAGIQAADDVFRG